MSWVQIVTPIATFFGGSTGAALVHVFHGRRSTEAVVKKDEAQAVELLTTSVTGLAARLDSVESQLNATRTELEQTRTEQSRLRNLFGEAVRVLRDFLDISREHDIPAPRISGELMAEIGKP